MPFGSENCGVRIYDGIGIKYIYELAKIKKEFDPDLKHHSTLGICKSIIAQMKGMGFYPTKDMETPVITIPNKFKAFRLKNYN